MTRGTLPAGANAITFAFALYPRSLSLLQDLLELSLTPEVVEAEPQYVEIDLVNLRNEIRALLQHVASGDVNSDTLATLAGTAVQPNVKP